MLIIVPEICTTDREPVVAAESTKLSEHAQKSWDLEALTPHPLPIPRVKLKTRPPEASHRTRPSKDSAENPGPETLATEDDTKLAVRTSSKEVLTRMLSSYTPAAGGIDWEDLVAAMVDAGCSVTPTGGSVVTFRDETNGKGSIVFHRPHPHSVIEPIVLRSMGKRLRKWFGWEAETFVERE